MENKKLEISVPDFIPEAIRNKYKEIATKLIDLELLTEIDIPAFNITMFHYGLAVEAMAAGTVVVSTRVGGTINVVKDGISGILVPPSDPKSIADAVCEVLENNDLRDRLMEGGFKCAQLFNIRSMVNKFEDLYAKLLCV